MKNANWESIAESKFAFEEETYEKAQRIMASLWNRRVVTAQTLREMAIEINNLQGVLERTLMEISKEGAGQAPIGEILGE